MSIPARRRFLAVTAVTICLSNPTAAQTKRAPDAARGQELATRLCASCHVVRPQQSGVAVAGVPSFASIAQLPGRDTQHLKNTMMNPHPPMPDVQLTRQEIEDIVAFITSLRGDAPAKPKPRPKPTYPSQS